MAKTTIFKTLITGDIFRFSDEETVYLVCYNKNFIIGNNVIEEVERRRNLHKRWQKSRFSRGVEYNQYFHRKKLILKTKKNDYG